MIIGAKFLAIGERTTIMKKQDCKEACSVEN
jgi:hypothetical protein